MSKRYVAIFTVIIFIIAMLPLSFVQKVHAYTNTAYSNNLKIGLVSMSASNITITLNGDYTINSKVYPSGSVLNLAINGTNIALNGVPQTEINLIPNNNTNLLTITSGLITNKYMGSFLIKLYNGKILPINIIDMENYLKGVVGYEMSDYFPIEALKTQAVAARNYALSRIGYEITKGYDFDDTISYQVYKGYDANDTNVLSAVEQTNGQVLLYNDKLVETLYSAWHGGFSENSENVWGNYVPYLRSVKDIYESDAWPNGNIILTNAQIQTLLVKKSYLTSTDTFVKLDLSSITNFTSGRVSNINIIYQDSTGLTKTKSFIKDSTRTFLSLPSNLYTVTYDEATKSYNFSGKGNGHGLGMSQIGAKNRATAGQTFDQILKFYYQNSYLQNLVAAPVVTPVYKANLDTVTQSSNTLFVGEKITFNSTASGGSGADYLFKYVIKNGTNVVSTIDYNNTASLDFVPSSEGSYTVEVYVKDKLSTLDYDAMKQLTITVYSKPTMTFTASQTSGLVKSTFNYNITGSNGSGKMQYKFVVTKNNTVVTDSGYSDSNTFSFIPIEAGLFQVTGYLKDVVSQNEFDAKNTLDLSVYNLKISNITAIGSFYEGKVINFNTTSNSPTALTYKYEVYNNENIITSNNFNNLSTFNFTPTVSGSYTVKVFIKDASSTNTYDNMKQFNITIDKKPLYLSVLPLKYGMTNNDVTSLQNALIKLGYSISDKQGYFGTQTKIAVTSFQKSKALTNDGIVGNMTYGVLNDTLIEKAGTKTLTY